MTNDSTDHARKGSLLVKDVLLSFWLFTESEITTVCSAIYNHSNKGARHCSFDEVLIDADVLHHFLYNPMLDIFENEKARYQKLKNEFLIV